MGIDDNLIHFNLDDAASLIGNVTPSPKEGLNERERTMLHFNLPKREKEKPIIKVIGVGGGGCNAVDHMYKKGINGVTFVNTNTDMKALRKSSVPIHLQLGKDGLGAGNIPEAGRQAAENSIDDIRQMLSDGTKMVFITAGMGGGTGTGAAPIIAREAKALSILTIAIITIPFLDEGIVKVNQALMGLDNLSRNVDAMIVISNQRLLEYYKDYDCISAYNHADDTLCNAARSIVDIINTDGKVNVDFHDVEMVLKDGHVAVISTAYAEGVGRLSKAIEEALSSPLVNHHNMTCSKKILINVSFSQKQQPLMMAEMNELMEFLKIFQATAQWVKYGLVIDDSLGQKIKVTILTSGFCFKETVEPDANIRHITNDRLETIRCFYEQLYGNVTITDGKQHNYTVYSFTSASLDDDEIIEKVSRIPTYMRRGLIPLPNSWENKY